ncbi:MAG: hypothetical protein PHP53_16405 [Prolixibacteraceae bacterium]|nr:hypothetical protein [Prolixibacteraceae bacterium]
MKKLIILFITVVAVSSLFVSCKKDEWSKGDPALANVYYVGFQNWADFKNSVKFNVNRNDTVSIPVQFYSEQVCSYDVVTKYYVTGAAVLGTDFNIVDKSGTVLTPDANGAFSLTWPQAIKGVKRVYVKALNGSAKTFLVQTFDPNDTEVISYTHTPNNATDQYQVNAFTQNYKVTVTIK